MLVTEFLTNLKARGQYQAAQTVLTDTDYIRFANDEMRMVICPKILSVRQNYFMGQKDYPLTSSRRYRLPSRILGNRISLVRVFPGSTTDGGHFDLNQTSIKQKHNGRQGFYMSQGDLILTGDVPSGIMRVFYPIRPPKISATATIIATCTAPATLNFNTDYAGVNITAQVVRSSSPFRTISPNCQIGVGASYDMDSPFEYERFQPGDQVITVDSTPAVPLQEQLCDWLLQRTHMRVLTALGQVQELAAQGSKLQDIEQSCLALINPRVADEPKVIIGMQSAGWGGTY